MKNRKANYKVSVYLVNDKTSYRLRFYYKETGKFLPQFEQRFEAATSNAALQKRDAEQANPKWLEYKEENVETKGDFLAYFDKVGQSKELEGTRATYNDSLMLFKRFRGNGTLPFRNMTKELANDFREFLLRTVKQNTASCRYACFTHVINRAIEENLLERIKVKRIPQQLVKKDVLTEDEINALIKTEWVNRFRSLLI